jgi:phosphatidate phosphatase PAH1
MKKVVIVDIDGTIAECSERAEAYLKGKKDWESFYETSVHDEPVADVVEVVKVLECFGYPIVLMTGRPEKYRGQTAMWLFKHGIKHSGLLMRRDGDYREDFVVKKEMFLKLLDSVLCVFEDRKQVVDMWRSMGVTCFQVRDGDY